MTAFKPLSIPLKTVGKKPMPRAHDTPLAEHLDQTLPKQQRRRIERRRMIELTKRTSAAEQIGTLPGPGEIIHGRMGGEFDGFDFVPAFLDLIQPATIRSLWLASLSFNRRNIERLVELIDAGKVKQCQFLCSEMFSGKERATVDWAKDQLLTRGSRLFFGRNHMKLILAHTTDRRHLCLEGSMNLRSCRCTENYCISDDRELFEFHRNYIESMGRK